MRDPGDEREGVGWSQLRDVVPYVLYVYDVDTGHTEYLSRHLGTLLGYDDAQLEALGAKLMPALLHPDDLARLPELLRRWETVGDGDVVETEHRMRHADGDYRWMLGRDRVLERDPDGRVRRILGTSIDVTARKTLETELAQARTLEAIGRVTGNIAHDFNNLLTVVLSGLELALDPSAPVGSTAELLCDARDAARQASTLTRQLLDFARQGSMRPGTCDLSATVHESERVLARLATGAVGLVVTVHGEPLVVHLDVAQVTQLLVNLVTNARDAMAAGPGEIHVEVRRTGELAELVVRDTGRGMPPDVIERAFEPFFTTKPAGSGTGLGLATVYAIAARAGGRARIESALGLGTCVTVSLPVVTHPERS